MLTSVTYLYVSSAWSWPAARQFWGHGSGENKKRKHKLFDASMLWKMKEGFLFPLWLESDFLCGYDLESRGTHGESASVWRCQMIGFASNRLPPNGLWLSIKLAFYGTVSSVNLFKTLGPNVSTWLWGNRNITRILLSVWDGAQGVRWSLS